jgi:ABC-type nickel/cobalt efflux system permease component RcnA
MTDAAGTAAVAAPIVLLCLIGMWFLWPMMERSRRRHRAASGMGSDAVRLGEAKR